MLFLTVSKNIFSWLGVNFDFLVLLCLLFFFGCSGGAFGFVNLYGIKINLVFWEKLFVEVAVPSTLEELAFSFYIAAECI